jgi:hypothetical protein
MIKQLAIFGDSWAFSSWRKEPDFKETIDTINFQLLFADHHITATNFAKPGNTNLDSIQLIYNNAELIKEVDLIIVFQTDPIRQLLNKDSDNTVQVELDAEIPLSESLPDLCEKLLINFYQELETISITYNVPILLIGGCTCLSYENVPDRIFTIDKSWTEMCVTDTDFKDCYYYWLEPTLRVYETARKKFNWSSSLADFFEFEKMILEKNHIWQASDHFSWCHAGKSAYKIMFDTILSTMKKIDFKRKSNDPGS